MTEKGQIALPVDTDQTVVQSEQSIFDEVFTPEKLRGLVVERVHAGRTIDFWGSRQHGDNMIRAWANYLVLQHLCRSEGINPDAINLRIIPNSVLFPPQYSRQVIESLMDVGGVCAEDESDDGFDFTFRAFKVTGNYRDSEIDNFWLSSLSNVAKAVGITLSQDAAMTVPQPLRLANTPFANFDRDLVIQTGTSKREMLSAAGEKPLIAIAQSGSVAAKRFSDEQVIQLAVAAKEANPNSCVIIVTDKRFRQERTTDEVFQGHADEVIASDDINQISSYFLATDLLVTTDSFWGWLGAGAKALRADRDGKLYQGDAVVLYTIGIPKYWSIPGADIITSPRLLECVEQKKRTSDGMIQMKDYAPEIESEPMIRDEDIDLVQAQMVKHLVSTRSSGYHYP